MKILKAILGISAGIGSLAVMCSANAAQFTVSIDGGDAIFLAGRTDLVIPPAGAVWPGGLTRHPVTPELIKETLPPIIPVAGGQTVRVLDPADGAISFFNGFGGVSFGPQGNGVPGSSSLGSFGGISGYFGTQGALVGVFLTNAVPSAGPPATLDFSAGGLGVDFTTLSPALNQVFFIGDGKTNLNVFQEFVAPAGTTRLALGVVDGFGFNGPPGAYDDNDGGYRIRVGIDEIPVPGNDVPIPGALPLFASGLGMIGLLAWRRKRKRDAVAA